MATRVQTEVVPELMKKNADLGRELAILEKQAREMYEAVYGEKYQEMGQGRASFREFLQFLANLPGTAPRK